MVKNTGKNISKSSSSRYNQTFFDHANQSAKDAFRTASKRETQKQKQLVIWLVIKLLIKLEKSHHKILID